jgi:dipeptidyl aminopeptidase/acylaminoacyl peptidase
MKTLRALAIFAGALLFPGLLLAQSGQLSFTPQDMLGIVEFVPGSEPILSPDGAWLAYATTDPSIESNILAVHPNGFLWIKKTGGGPVRLVAGDYADTPVWSPDGRELAFFRARKGRSQLCVWTVATGKVRELGESFPKDESLWPSEDLAPQWTSGSGTIVYPALAPAPSQPDPEWELVHSTDATMPGDAPFLDRRKWTLVSVDVNTNKTHALVPQPVSLTRFAIARDESRVLFRAITPETLALFRHEQSRDWIVPTDGSQPPQAVLDGRSPAWVVFSPSSREFLFPEKEALRSIEVSGGNEKVVVDKFPKKTRDPRASSSGSLAVFAARLGTGAPDEKMYSILEPTWDVVVVQLGQGPIQELTESEKGIQNSDLVWSSDGHALFYRSVDEEGYRETIHRWQSGENRSVYSADRSIHSLAASRDGSAMVFTAMSATAPDDGYLLEAGKSEPSRVTDLNPQLAKFTFQAPRMFRFYSAHGDPLEAMLYLPPGTDANHQVPVVTYVYEKLSQFKNRFELDAQWHVAHGYGYLMPDVIVRPGFLSEAYVTSVIPAVNAVRAMNLTTGRFGITGGSLGGIAGLSLISRSDIFAAAVLRAPPSDFFSTWADGRDRDIWTIETGQGRAGGTPWDQRDTYIQNSPFFQADRVHTPVLIVHGKADFTVPFQQGLMMFAALRALHRTADLLIYRDAEHSVVRGSRFRFIDLHERTLDWWERYLRGNGSTKAKANAH